MYTIQMVSTLYFLRAAAFKMSLVVGMEGRLNIARAAEEWAAPDCPDPACRSTTGFFHDFLQPRNIYSLT